MWASFLAFFVNIFSLCDWTVFNTTNGNFGNKIEWDAFCATAELKQPDIFVFLRRIGQSQMFEHFLANQLALMRTQAAKGASISLPPLLVLLKQPGVENSFSFTGVVSALKSSSTFNLQFVKGVSAAAADVTSNSPTKKKTSQLMIELETASFDSRAWPAIAACVDARLLDSRGRNWKHGSKALALLHAFITRGAVFPLLWISRPESLRHLYSFAHYSHSDSKVQELVRAQAAELLATVSNVFALRFYICF